MGSSVEDAVTMLLEAFPNMTSEERIRVIDRLSEEWCKLCGDPEPCYCASSYDE